ncbi:MAG TPA: LamG domain-containing protein [Candidatus Methylomirabilis sp.]|nr:LamG domain-containing protein [Candidatus Methylomirabilis sp.]
MIKRLIEFGRKQEPLLGVKFGVKSFRNVPDQRKIQPAKKLEWDNRAGLVLWLNDKGKSVDTWQDQSGQGNNGATHGSPTPPKASPAALGYIFDGVDDYIDCGNAISGMLSFTVWIKPTVQMATYKGIMGVWSSATTRSWLFDSALGYWEFTISTTGSDSKAARDTTLYSAGVWYNLFGVSTGTDVLLYVNGVQAANAGSGGIIQQQTDPVLLGKFTTGNFCSGTINDVRIYTREVSASEILNYFEHTRGKYGV